MFISIREENSTVRRIRKVSDEKSPSIPQEYSYHGFGSVRGETIEQFHERMFDLPPLEAMLYEMEVAFDLDSSC